MSSSAYAQEEVFVVLNTDKGPLVIEFFPEDAPNHVKNFISLAQDGYYDDTVFHRIIPDFMIQGGDPNTRSYSGATPDQWGMGGPETTLEAEFNAIMHNRGIVSMARSMDPNSAGSQFFIVHRDANFLDAQYTVFGRLVTEDSYDTLDDIAAVETDERDRPTDPQAVRVITTEVMSRGDARIAGLDLLNFGEPDRIQPTEAPPPPNRVYENEDLNFSITFPVGWTIQSLEGVDLPDVVAVSPNVGAVPSSIAVFVEESMGSLDDAIRDKLATLESLQDVGTFEITRQEKIRLGDRDAFILNAQDRIQTAGGLTQIKYQEVTILVGDNLYTMLFSGDVNNYDDDLRLFEDTLETFNVLEEPTMFELPFGGGCLIATAAFGSEISPQVQQLRELRDGSLMGTDAGRGFMEWFNTIYYSFSPAVADYERENPAFREMVRLSITPMISILSLLNHVDMGTEAGAIMYGSAAILLIILAYVGAPIAAVLWLRRMVGRRHTHNIHA